MFLSADLPDWCSDALAIRLEIPPSLRLLGGSAQVAELIAIYAGHHHLHSLQLCGAFYSECLSAVKNITRRWFPGHAFTEAGAALVISSRSYLLDSIPLQCLRATQNVPTPLPAAWSRRQWGFYLANGVSKNRDLGSLPFSPIPSLKTQTIPLSTILSATPPTGSWQWVGPESTPPLGNLRSMISHHRALAYRAKRDTLRALRHGRCPTPITNNPCAPECTPSAPYGIFAGMQKTGRSPRIPRTLR